MKVNKQYWQILAKKAPDDSFEVIGITDDYKVGTYVQVKLNQTYHAVKIKTVNLFEDINSFDIHLKEELRKSALKKLSKQEIEILGL